MLKSKITIAVMLLLLTIITVGCSNDDDKTADGASQVSSNLRTGVWRVTYFYDDGDETYHFQNYAFTFADGTLTASNGSNTVSGTWSVINSGTSTKLILGISAGEPWSELNDDWHILERTNSKIRMEDVSGSGETDYLTLEKI